jgi:hypothetical protein
MNEQHPENKLIIHNSTAEFLIFTQQAGEGGIEVRYEDGSIWLTQKLMAELFNVDVRTISEHLKNIYASGELQEDSVIRKFRITASDGKNYNTLCYNLDAIISVGYRVNSTRATQFRQWATKVLKEFAIKGFVLDKKRLENGIYAKGLCVILEILLRYFQETRHKGKIWFYDLEEADINEIAELKEL